MKSMCVSLPGHRAEWRRVEGGSGGAGGRYPAGLVYDAYRQFMVQLCLTGCWVLVPPIWKCLALVQIRSL